jgi:hypothetical protein
MAVSTSQVATYFPALQPFMTEVQNLTPKTGSTAQHKKDAVRKIALGKVTASPEFMDEVNGKLKQQVDKYVEMTHRLHDYNEVYNTNMYIANELMRNDKNIEKTKKKLKNTIYASKQKAQTYEYETHRWKYYRTLFLITAFVVIDLITLVGVHIAGGISAAYFYTMMGIIAFLYTIAIIIVIYSNSFRSRYDWDKYMWHGINQSDPNSSCSV